MSFIETPEYKTHKADRFPTVDLQIPLADNEAFLLADENLRTRFRKRYQSTASLYYKGQPDFDELLAKLKGSIVFILSACKTLLVGLVLAWEKKQGNMGSTSKRLKIHQDFFLLFAAHHNHPLSDRISPGFLFSVLFCNDCLYKPPILWRQIFPISSRN